MPKASLNARIDSTVKENLEEVCAWSDRSQSYHTEQALKDYLAKEMAFKTMIHEADSDIKAGRTVSHMQAMTWLKSWGTKNEIPMPESSHK